MRLFEKIAACIAGGLVSCIPVHAGDAIPPKNPYATIITRNAFGLLPILPAIIPVEPAEPPPKLVPTGIITVFGRPQVLFNMVNRQNSVATRPPESSYVLAEGEEEDEVTIIHIDATTGLVVFNNHGTIQQIPLPAF